MKQERLDRLTEAHGATTKPARRKVAAVEGPEPEAPAVNLDDPNQQDLILNPEGKDIELSYGTIRLHTPSMMIRKLGHGFARGVFAEAAETKPSTLEILSARIDAVLEASPAPLLKLFRLIGYMCGRAGLVSDADANQFAAELADKTGEGDVAILFATLCTACGFDKTAHPKN